MAGKGAEGDGSGNPVAPKIKAHILVVEARYYQDVADEMIAGVEAELDARGATFERIAVPGALEIPQVLAQAIEAGRIGSLAEEMAGNDGEFDGAIAIGCVIRGETSHYDIVCANANHWLMEQAMQYGVPLGNAILTVDTKEQAMARAEGGRRGKGGDAARACLRVIEVARALRGRQ